MNINPDDDALWYKMAAMAAFGLQLNQDAATNWVGPQQSPQIGMFARCCEEVDFVSKHMQSKPIRPVVPNAFENPPGGC